jgi:hypothetical protein
VRQPQIPALHAIEQQSALLEQVLPWAPQLIFAHTPLVQVTIPAAQQSVVWVQVPPTAWQAVVPQLPLVQMLEQHSLGVEQLMPEP